MPPQELQPDPAFARFRRPAEHRLAIANTSRGPKVPDFGAIQRFSRTTIYLHVARHDDPSLGAPDRLRRCVVESARFFERHRWAWIASASTFWNDPELRFRRERIGWRDRSERLVRDILEAGIAAGEIRPLDVPVAGRMILGAINWMPRWYDPKGPLTAPDIAQSFCDMVLGGILAPVTATPVRKPRVPA